MIPPHLQIVEGSSSERDLILAAQAGDTSSFQQLYEKYKDRVYNLIYYSVDEPSHAEDVLQTVFVKVFQALPAFRLDSCFLTWVYRVAINECKNRKRRRRLFVSMSELPQVDAKPDPALTPEVEHLTNHVALMVRNAIMELNPKLRAVIALKYFEDLSYEEIASILGCSSGTVASRMHRALNQLEKNLQSFRGVV
jgi:RNA polymerase sigma-70 factor, ECF subfamily